MTDSQQGPDLPRSLGPKALMLFLLPLPLLAVVLAAVVGGDLLKLLKSGVCFALFMAAAVVMRKGMMEEVAFSLRRFVAKPPAPLKLAASLLVGVATGLSALFLSDQSLLEAVGFGLGATVGSVLFYGLDPRPARATQLDAAAAEVLALAEQKILDIEQANASISCVELTERLDRITGKARRVLDILDDRPTQLGNARRFLSTYLEGAERVARGYARTHRQAENMELDDKFRNVLATIENAFDQQRERLLEDEVMDLDVQIEVLTTQIEREGV
ncbi:MAG: 5-bromo-4-chloroindolyl phosphate hydrolysis family protein [Pseudomonadota bacterium]